MNNLKVSNSSTSFQGNNNQEKDSKNTRVISNAVVDGVLGGVANKAVDAAVKNGELVRAMSPSAQDKLADSTAKISRFITLYKTSGHSVLYGNDPLPLGVPRTTKKEIEKQISAEYKELAKIIKNDLHNISLNNPSMASIASQTVTSLNTRAQRIASGAETPGEFHSDRLHSMNSIPERNTGNSIDVASNTITKGYQQDNIEAAAISGRNLNPPESQSLTTQGTDSKTDVLKVVTLLKDNAAEVKKQSGLDVNTDEGLGKAMMQYWKENNLDPKTLKEQLPNIKESELTTASKALTNTNATETTNTRQLSTQQR